MLASCYRSEFTWSLQHHRKTGGIVIITLFFFSTEEELSEGKKEFTCVHTACRWKMSTDPKPFSKPQYFAILGHDTSETRSKNDHRLFFFLTFPGQSCHFVLAWFWLVFVCFVFCYSHKLLKMKTPPVGKGFAMFFFTARGWWFCVEFCYCCCCFFVFPRQCFSEYSPGTGSVDEASLKFIVFKDCVLRPTCTIRSLQEWGDKGLEN